MVDNRYPKLWQRGLIQARVRERAGHCCESCGMEFIKGTNLSVDFHPTRTGKLRRMIGTVHHINEVKSDCRMSNLVFLCQQCHWGIHANNWRVGYNLPKTWRGKPQKWMIARGVPYKGIAHTQMSIFDLIEQERS